MSKLLKHALSDYSQEFFWNDKKIERAPKKKLSFDKTMKVLADSNHSTVNRYTESQIREIEELMVKGSIPKQLREFLLTYGGTTFNADSGKVQIGSASWVKAVLDEAEKLQSPTAQGMFPLVKGKDIWVTCSGGSSGSVDQVKRKHGFAFDSSEMIFSSFGAWLADVVQETYDVSTEEISEDYAPEGFWKNVGDAILEFGKAYAEQAALYNKPPLSSFSVLQVKSSNGPNKIIKVSDLVRIVKSSEYTILVTDFTSLGYGANGGYNQRILINLLDTAGSNMKMYPSNFIMNADAIDFAELMERSVNTKVYIESKICLDDNEESMESTSQENCADCDIPTSSNLVTNQPVKEQNGEDKNSFTYDEGKGKKDIIQLSGPLSEVYTRALNIYYAKKPAFDTDSMPEGLSQSDTEALMSSSMIAKTGDQASQESAQLDDTHMRAIVAAVHSNRLNEEAKDKFEFVNDSVISDIKNTQTDVVAQFTPFEDALKPEVIDTVQTAAEDKNKQVIMVITDNDHFFSRAMNADRRHIDLSENANYNPVFGPKEFDAAVESLYVSNGITVVNGFKGLVQHLNTLAK